MMFDENVMQPFQLYEYICIRWISISTVPGIGKGIRTKYNI